MAAPKVFSLWKTSNYAEVFPNVAILGKKKDFFLECNTYDAMIPVVVRAEKRLDIFEEAVLKLISYQSATKEEIAAILCLPEDLINFVIIRLREMELLDKNGMTVTEIGKNYLKVDSSVTTKLEQKQAKIFVIKKTGDILPYIHIGEFSSETVEDYSPSHLTLDFGTAGHPVKIKGKCLRIDKENRWGEPYLQSDKIKNALKRYNKIVAGNPRFFRIKFDKEWVIENTVSDNVYFHMQAVVQKGNADEILVSDGMVENIDFVNKYVTENYQTFKSKVQQDNTQNTTSDESSRQVYAFNRNSKYSSLEKVWKGTNNKFQELKAMESAEETVVTQDSNRQKQFEQKKYLQTSYAAFEWCFYYYDKQNPLEEQMLKLLGMQTSSQNRKTIEELLDRLGVRSPDKYTDLFSGINIQKIQQIFRVNCPELRNVLGIAIINGAQEGASLMGKLLQIRPDLLNILLDLFHEHGDLSHQSKMPEFSFERDQRIYDALRDSITTLLPDFSFGEETLLEEDSVVGDKISQERLNAIVCLSKELGSMYFNNMISRDLKNEWIQISPNRSQEELPEESVYVDIMYRILQDTLYREVLDIRKQSDLKKEVMLSCLKEKGIQSVAFQTVKEKFVSDILHDINSTLGAVGFVYLYYQDDEKTKKLVEIGYVTLIEKLVKLRAHGSNVEVGLRIDTKGLNDLRATLIAIVRMIGGNES